MTVGLNGKTSVRKGDISREAVMVESPKKEFDFVGEFEFPNPTQGKRVQRRVGILSSKVLISRFGREGTISSTKPKRSVSLYPRIRFKRVLEVALQGHVNVNGEGI